MSKKTTSPLPNADDRLAGFADRVINGQLPSASDWDKEDEEMHSLGQLVTRLDEEFRSGQPEPDMAKRIKANLVAEWHKSELGTRPATAKEHWWDRLAQAVMPTVKRRPGFTFALAAVVIIVVAVVALSPLASGTMLPGTADGKEDIFPAVLLISLMVLGIFVWLARRRQ